MAEFVYRSMILFVLVFLILQSSGSHGQMLPANFVFGDSLVDVGNNNYLLLSLAKANFPHNGIDLPSQKATGRFSNGKNIVDLLAGKVGLPSPPPYLSIDSDSSTSYLCGVSFASDGAAIFDITSNPLNTESIPLRQQVEYYLKVYEYLRKRLGFAHAQKRLSKSLFFIVIGSNDILNYSRSIDQNKPPKKHVNQMTTLLKAKIHDIANDARCY
ncbi:GDSL esterase/lipase At5g55050-like [Punica granatum]|uniref:GDSL esterase/lipase At5g55050-like n=1 Tax=Punica granatum TaxID=22663 RepID=A0A6P8EJI1_PUNGR|nr:GDSL esterase/lipase At5g55050-like [Punica granatum]